MGSKNKFLFAFLIFSFLFCNYNFYAQQNQYNFIGIKTAKGDTLPFINLLIQNKWKATVYKNNKKLVSYTECVPDTIRLLEQADKIVLTTVFDVDSQLINQTFVLHYLCKDNFRVNINGEEIINHKVNYDGFSILSKNIKSKNYFLFSKKQNIIEVELHKKDIESITDNEFKISTIKWKDDKIKEENSYRETIIIKLIIFLTIGIVVFIQFFFYKTRKENFYFALYCILYSLNLIEGMIDFSSQFRPLFLVTVGFSSGALINYLSIVFTEKKHSKWPSFILAVIFLIFYPLSFLIDDRLNVVIIISTFLFIIYNFFVCLYILFQGSNKKKWETKFVTYGFFIALIVYILFFVLLVIFESSKSKVGLAVVNYLFEFPILILPLTLAVMIGKRNGMNQKELVSKYEEIKILSEENLNKEKEKQLILSEQNHLLENKVEERTQELVLQKHIVEEKQKEIIESINYAKRLQQAILPPIELINAYLPHSFVLYQPKDIIAGDFYWMETVGDLILITAADCTGHGVPGALVSVVCSNALNRAVKEFKLVEPGKILDKTKELVLETFEKSVSEVKDGMDISLLCIDKSNKTVFWSGANNPLWYVEPTTNENSDASWELIEIKADKQPIGKSDHGKTFTTHQIKYKENTSFYLFTDGYADQFGGPKGKKFKYKPMQELIISMQDQPMQSQAEIFSQAFNQWKKNLEQVDDVCLIGIKL
jgi:serine phosphatase RsbU (regulator of sigma subunit)